VDVALEIKISKKKFNSQTPNLKDAPISLSNFPKYVQGKNIKRKESKIKLNSHF